MPETWERRIRRAKELAAAGGPTAALLAFYAQLLETQQTMDASFRDRRPSGSIDRDARAIAEAATPLLRCVAENGPEALAAEANDLLRGDPAAIEELLLTYWSDRAGGHFFAKAMLQPYAQWQVDSGAIPRGDPGGEASRCPKCGGPPQLSILDAGGSDGSSRHLLCANCVSPWPFPRIVCPSCGERDEHKLGYYQAPEFEHVRVDACDICHRYLKSIDLTRLGLAVPLVDEVAAAPLDVWATDHGYEKIELNLLGL